MGRRGVYSYSLPMPIRCLLMVFLLYSFMLTASQSSSCDSVDLTALLGFSAAMDSPIQGWKSNTPSDCCRWLGVFCDPTVVNGRRVVELDLAGKSLRGSLSNAVAGLDHLRKLNLSSNSFRGSIPDGLFRLNRLELLDLSMNDLSGSLPQEIILPSIITFNISNNFLNGSIPIFSSSPNLTAINVSNNSFHGPINADICNSSSKVELLIFSMNSLSGEVPVGFGKCHSLVQLSLDVNGISGSLPEDIFNLPNLKYLHLQQNGLTGSLSAGVANLSTLVRLDLSENNFVGIIPDIFDKVRDLETFRAESNGFNGSLPGSLSNLTRLRVLNLRNNSLRGEISLNFAGMPMLEFLDLGSNGFTGFLPESLSQCSYLNSLNLAKNQLKGEIPSSFGSLASLSYLSLSKNSFTNVSSALAILQQCTNLTALVLTMNFHDGEAMPVEGIRGFAKIEVLVIANCGLSGSIPPWLARSINLKILDLSWNQLIGAIPPWLGNFDGLFYLDLSNNSLTGEIPGSFAQLKSLISFNASVQRPPVQSFPFFVKRNASTKALQYNNVGSFPPSLVLSNNMLVGSIPTGFGNLKRLLVLDLHKNNLSGTIPIDLSGMASLENLDLSYNNLSGTIPAALKSLTFLSSFDVSYNNLVGPIPSGGQFSTFTSSDFIGNKGLCGFHLSPCQDATLPLSEGRKQKSKATIVGVGIGIGTGIILLFAIVYLVASSVLCKRQEDNTKVVADTDDSLESAGSGLVLLFHNKDSKTMSINAIWKSTNNFDQAYIIGCGGFGLVYKATLEDGRKVAIKRLSGDFCQIEREFQSEVETLSRAQHENLVPLQGYCKIGKDRLLIYSFMENGSLDYWLHEKPDGPSKLPWTKRVKIAQGAARALAYLHQSCHPNIIHRDIKSSNILLDEQFVAHLADFGLARLILPYDTHVTTELVGTLGYIPPEYSQASVATFKGDVYSFGVVLLELLTGRRPVDICKPRGTRELVLWVLEMRRKKKETEVFDPHIHHNELEKQLLWVLEIAILCVSDYPKLRPSTQQLVSWLDSIKTEG